LFSGNYYSTVVEAAVLLLLWGGHPARHSEVTQGQALRIPLPCYLVIHMLLHTKNEVSRGPVTGRCMQD